MRCIKRIDLKFEDEKREEEYTAIKKQNIMKDFQVTVGVIVLVTLSSAIERLARGDVENSITPLVTVGVLMIFYFIRKIFGRYIEYLTLAVIFAYSIYRMVVMKFEYFILSRASLYHAGYTYAILQMILISRISKIHHKIWAVVVAYLMRFGFIIFAIDPSSLQPGALIRGVIVDCFIIYYYYMCDKTERKVFQNFCESREELTKFKELLEHYLPQSVAVVDCITGYPLFSNKAFEAIFSAQEIKPDSSNNSNPLLRSNTAKQNLDFLRVDQSTIREFGTDIHSSIGPLSLLETPMSLTDVIQKLISKKLLTDKALSLTASYNHQQEQKSFEIVLKIVQWNRTNAVACILNDITHQEKLIALKVSNMNKDKIIATVSHELRTPLHGIIGFLDMTEKRIREPEPLEFISLCKDNAHLLLSLVNSLLDYQQISTGKLRLNITKVDILKTITNVTQLFQFQTRQKHILLDLQVKESIDTVVLTDENRLRQILINLVGNAIKFTLKGGVKILVDHDPDDLEHLKISVADTGIGIREEDKSKLFKMYGKLEDGVSVNKNGVGLGLTISNALAILLQGQEVERGIEVESEYGVGSTFSFKVLKDLNTISFFDGTQSINKNYAGMEGQRNMVDLDKETSKSFCRGRFREREIQNEEQACLNVLTGETITNISAEELINSNNVALKLETYNAHKKPNRQSATFSEKRILCDNYKALENETSEKKVPKSISIDSTSSKGCVLVVDDNAFNLLVADSLIKDLGFIAKVALGGQEAIDIVKKDNKEGKSIKAIFMDCQMPVMDGYETTKILDSMMKKREIKQIPILAWTANNSEEDIKRCYECGMVGYLTKPTSYDALLKTLSTLE